MATVWCEVSCRYCGENIFAEPYKNPTTIQRAKKRIRACGYVDDPEKGTICPMCAEGFKIAKKFEKLQANIFELQERR